MKLASYLSDNNISHEAFAEMIGTSQVAVSRYAKGVRTPRREIMLRIAQATGGQVAPADFFLVEEQAA
jgi:predicted transcriptional regulator